MNNADMSMTPSTPPQDPNSQSPLSKYYRDGRHKFAALPQRDQLALGALGLFLGLLLLSCHGRRPRRR